MPMASSCSRRKRGPDGRGGHRRPEVQLRAALEVSWRAPARGRSLGHPYRLTPRGAKGRQRLENFIRQKLTLGPGLMTDHGEMPKKVMVIVPGADHSLVDYRHR